MLVYNITPARPQPRRVPLPVYACRVRAGFPSPADDYLEARLDLNEYLVDDAAATFMVRVKGDSMIEAGIGDGDLLVVDRSVTPAHGHIVIAAVDGAFTVKRLYRKAGRVALLPENAAYKPIELIGEQELMVWGVVVGCVKRFA